MASRRLRFLQPRSEADEPYATKPFSFPSERQPEALNAAAVHAFDIGLLVVPGPQTQGFDLLQKGSRLRARPDLCGDLAVKSNGFRREQAGAATGTIHAIAIHVIP